MKTADHWEESIMLSTPAVNQQTIDRLLEARPISAFQWRLIVLLSVVFWFEGYDFQALALAVPFISAEWGVPASGFGWALGSVYIGMGFAALLVAPLGDRFGRKPMVVGGTIALMLSLYGTAFATGLWSLFAWRLLTGAALGALLPNASALLAEYMPPRARARALAWLTCSYALGALMASFVASPIIVNQSWEIAFLFSAVVTTALLAVLIMWLPESISFLSRSEKAAARADTILDRLGLGAILASPLHFGPVPARPKVPVIELLSKPYRRTTLYLWTMFTVNNGVFTILVLWLPTLIGNAGLDVGAAMRSTAMIWGGGILGGLILSSFMDRLGFNPWPIVAGLACAAACLLLFRLVPASDLGWNLLLFGAGLGITGLTFMGQPLGAALYPPELRATALGSVIAVPRIAGILAPLIVGLVIGWGLSSEAIVAALAVPTAIAALCAIILFRGAAMSRRLGREAHK